MEPGPAPHRGGRPRLFRRPWGVETSAVCSALAPRPSAWPAAGFARRPRRLAGLRSRPGPQRPHGPRSPGSGPSAALWRAPGALRPVGGPPAPVGAGRRLPRRPPLRRGLGRVLGGRASPNISAPGSGVVRPALRAAAGSLRGCSPLGCSVWACAPSSPRRFPLSPPPVGRPGYRHGPPRLLPPGGGWGGLRPPGISRRPPEKSATARAPRQGYRQAAKGRPCLSALPAADSD